jgi:hypothetical protein
MGLKLNKFGHEIEIQHFDAAGPYANYCLNAIRLFLKLDDSLWNRCTDDIRSAKVLYDLIDAVESEEELIDFIKLLTS